MQAQAKTSGKGEVIWFDSNKLPKVRSTHFQPEFWRKKNALIGSAVGRGTTYFFKNDGGEFVLRHYRRGGLIGKLLSDQYFFSGIRYTRAWREMELLMKMRELELPAPSPVAARVKRQAFYYRADIITEKIPHAQDVHQHLMKHSLTDEVWRRIGATIAQFHNCQVYHHDLNIHNIMLDDLNKVWLIDFDKCEMRSGMKWKQDNLDRLLRSLHKEQTIHAGYHFSEQNWLSVLEGYRA